jgi:hypothetical protein
MTESFINACNVPIFGRMINRRGKYWIFSEEFAVGEALKNLELFGCDTNSMFAVGEWTTAEQLKTCKKQMNGDALSNNFFEVRVGNEKASSKAFRGKWWGMKGSEFVKSHKNFPIAFDDEDFIICDVSFVS